MFCTACGSINPDNGVFCSKCGKKLFVDNNMQTFQTTKKTDELSILLSKINKLLPVLGQLDQIEEKISIIENEISKIDSTLKYYETKNGNKKTPIIASIGMTFAIDFMFVYWICVWLTGELGTGFVLCIIFSAVIWFILYKLLGGMNDLTVLIKKENDKKNSKFTEYENLMATKKQLMDSIVNDINIIPPNYRYYLAVEYIQSCLINQRAMNMQEAVNLFEEQLHRWKIENSQDKLLTLQRQQNSELNKIKIINQVQLAATILKK